MGAIVAAFLTTRHIDASPPLRSPPVRYGLTIFATDRSMDTVELAVEAEARGFDSIWIPEHTHIPTSRLTPPPTGDAELAEEYKRSLDPLITLAAIAAVTTTIRLGTGVMLPAEREPIVTAKAIATLQRLAAGRFSLGLGFGWNEDELADHGVSMADRREVTREHVEAMQELWSHDVASYQGRHVNFGPSWSWPKPGHPVPVLIGGGAGPKLFAHIAAYGTGWIPIGGSGLTEAVPRLRETVDAAGGDPSALEIVPFGSLPTAAKLSHFAEVGVTECVFRLPSAERDVVLPILDDHAELLSLLRS